MSIALMAYAWKLDIEPASKLVLLALADWSNDDGYCWPSIRQLCLKCSISERTVQNHIKGLCDAGHITRAERPGHGVHYRVHPVAPAEDAAGEAVESHYVYRLTNPDTGEFYIGGRSCFGDPAADDYKGSGNWARRMASLGARLDKTIIELYSTRQAMAFGELTHTSAVFHDPLCMNEKLPTPGTMTKPVRQTTPAKSAPRKICAPQITTGTPANSAPNTSVTINEVTNVTSPPTPQAEKPARKSSNPQTAGASAGKPAPEPLPDLPDWVPPTAWAGFVESRKRAKRPLTPHAATLIWAKLSALSLAGHPPGDVLDQSTMNGWHGVFKLKGDDDGRNGSGTGHSRGHDGGGDYRNPLIRAAFEADRDGIQ